MLFLSVENHNQKLFLPKINLSLGNSNFSSYGKSSACSSIPKSGLRDLVTPSLKYRRPAAANSRLNCFSLRTFHVRYTTTTINTQIITMMTPKYVVYFASPENSQVDQDITSYGLISGAVEPFE